VPSTLVGMAIQRGRRPAIGMLFGLYVAGVLAVTIFPISVHDAAYWAGEPWWTVFRWVPFDVDAPSFVGNVIMFVPLGVLAPLLWPVTDSTRRLAAYAVSASAAIEATQLVLGVMLGSRRAVDVNDLIANTAGAVLGLLLLRLALPSAAHRRELAVSRPAPPG
jgi:glycopeptide antibiotics resistance protein